MKENEQLIKLLQSRSIKGVIFDFDGTLLDIKPALNKAIEEVFEYYKINVSIETASAEIGAVLESIQANPLPKILLQSYEIFKYIESLKNIRYLKKLKISAKIFTKYLTYSKEAAVFKGTIELLKYLSEFSDIYIASHNKREKIIEHLKKEGIEHYFKGIYGTDDLPELKPSPEALMPIFEQYDSARSKEFIMVGDMPTDIEAGQEAGLWTIGIASGISNKEVLGEYNPDILIHSLTELINLIGINKSSSNPELKNTIKVKS